MIISKTPLRVSFVGGGSDLPQHYRRFGGSVISCGIDKYVFITVNARFDPGIRLSYSRTEDVGSAAGLSHPLVRAALEKLNLSDGLEITSVADVPARGSGLGSSSSFTVGLLHALYAYKGQYRSKPSLGAEACEIEIDICGEPIGKQDQYAAAMGGLNEIRFNRDDTVDIEPIPTPPGFIGTFERSLMVFYTGITRSASAILRKQVETLERNADKSLLVQRLAGLVPSFRQALHSGDLSAIGGILHEGWTIKASITDGITNPEIDDAYRLAREAGAIGGKLLGAGGGGFLLFCVPAERQQQVRSALSHLREVPMAIDWTGTSIVFYTPPRLAR